MPRLFTAIELPEEIQDLLGDLQAPLQGARWVEMDDLHLTLRFAGDIDTRQADEFCYELSTIDEVAFPMRISGLGVFGGYQPKTLGPASNPDLSSMSSPAPTIVQRGMQVSRRRSIPSRRTLRLRGSRTRGRTMSRGSCRSSVPLRASPSWSSGLRCFRRNLRSEAAPTSSKTFFHWQAPPPMSRITSGRRSGERSFISSSKPQGRHYSSRTLFTTS